MKSVAVGLARVTVVLAVAVLWPQTAGAQCTDYDSDGFFYESGCGTAQDCNDAAPTTYPGATEICDGYDNDCDGHLDNQPACDGNCDLPGGTGGDVRITMTGSIAAEADLVWNGTTYGLVWQDGRHVEPEIYFARVDPQGNKIGGDVRITDEVYESTSPAVVWTGLEYGVTWMTSQQDVYFTRLDVGGNQIGTAVRIASGEEPDIVWNGSEYAIVWIDSATGDWLVHFVRLDYEGNVVGADETINQDPDARHRPTIVWTGALYGVAWEDYGSDHVGAIEYQVLDAQGTELPLRHVIESSRGGFVSAAPSIAWNGIEFGIAWLESSRVDFARIGTDGQQLGSSIRLVESNGDERPSLTWNGAEYGAVCADIRHGQGEIYIARVDATGTELGAETRLTEQSDRSANPAIVWNGSSYAIAWEDDRDGVEQIYFKNISCDCHDVDADSVTVCQGDCDDNDGNTYPGASELCDGVNNNCSDTAWPIVPANEADIDGDSVSECQGDCDDAHAQVFPGAAQACDGVNNDCLHPNWPVLTGTNEADDDSDSVSECAGDCNDDDIAIYPGASQVCDGLNNDCLHPSWPGFANTNEGDDDGDSFAECGGDCDDTRGDTYPAAPQLCDGLNNDCSDNWPTVPITEIDDDGDTYAECQGDCNDTDNAVSPGATEVCNSIDDDCDILVDEDALGEDTDGDTVHNLCDNCPEYYDPLQQDTDDDTVGNVCDNCITDPNPLQEDLDSDQRGDICDNCIAAYNPLQDDFESDGVGDACDNCFFGYNPSQSDFDTDFEGDHCDLDDGLIYLLQIDPDWPEWQVETGFDAWNFYAGDFEVLRSSCATSCEYTQIPGSNLLAQKDCGLTDPWAYYPTTPAAGKVAYFLTTGLVGVVEGDLGQDSFGSTRSNDNPCP